MDRFGRVLIGEDIFRHSGLSLRERGHQPLYAAANQRVDDGEVRGKSEDRNNHDGCGGAHLLPGGPGHALHFELQFLEVVLDLGGPRRRLLRETEFFRCHKKLPTGTDCRALPRKGPGRGGGIRTPTRGFGDRWSAVKPTPLFHTSFRTAVLDVESTSVYLISLCAWCLRQKGQYLLSSSRSGVVFLFLVLL